MRTLFHIAAKILAVTVLLAGAAVVSTEYAAADPDFTLDPASPSLAAVPATPADILRPFGGWPKWGGQAVPAVALPGIMLGLPAGAAIDDFSYGDEVPAGPIALAYSVDRNAIGIPGDALAIEAGAPEGAVGADLYTTMGPLLPAPCGLPPVLPNALLADGDGRTAGAPPPRLGLGLGELPPFAYGAQDNISGVELEAYAGGAVYFTVDAATAGLLGVSAADILAYFPAAGGWVMWAPAGLLGLGPGDDIDALAVGDATPPDMMFTPGADWLFVSLKPGSPSLMGPLAHCPGGIVGPASSGDVWWTSGGPLAPFADAEMLGLATARIGLGVDDNLDALDFVSVAAPIDTDLDGADDAIDFDDDNDVCADAKEPALVPPTNPLDPWDFYSVPVPALIAAPNPLIVFKDDAVGAADAQAVFAYFKAGSKAGTPSYEQDLNANGVKDGWEYDRTIVLPGPMSGAPDGVVTAQEAQLVFAQFKRGYKC